jgi:hypothetical protein
MRKQSRARRSAGVLIAGAALAVAIGAPSAATIQPNDERAALPAPTFDLTGVFAGVQHAAQQQQAVREFLDAQAFLQARARAERASRARSVRRAPVVVPGEDVWARLRACESGGNYAANTGNGFYGAYQFSLSTWQAIGYGGYPHEAAPAVQDEAARRLQARSGWGQWPACSRRLGLR